MRRHTLHRDHTSGQAVVETALALPVLLMIIFIAIDLVRFTTLRGSLDAAVHRGARVMLLYTTTRSDCYVLSEIEKAAPGTALRVDPGSVWNDAYAVPAATPATNTGLIYLWPAVAQGPNPTETSRCQAPGSNSRPGPVVAAAITYTYAPITPIVNAFVPTLKVSVRDQEYAQY